MKITKTTDYDQFHMTPENRARISLTHVRKIKQSLQRKNMLDLNPIIVDADLNIIDGQHRFLAARELGIDIFYMQDDELVSEDIIDLNISNPWKADDYLNYYVQKGYTEYKKVKQFMNEFGLTLSGAMAFASMKKGNSYDKFKMGSYVFNIEDFIQDVEVVQQTIHVISKMNGQKPYTKTCRFVRTLLAFVWNPDFVAYTWFKKIELQPFKFGVRPSALAYSQLFYEVYNWKNKNPISA